MYTHKSIETVGTLTMLISIFISILVASLILFFIMIILKQKNKMINGFTVLSLSAISILVSGQLLYSSGIIVDEIGLNGDPALFYSFLAITGMGIISDHLLFYTRKIKQII